MNQAGWPSFFFEKCVPYSCWCTCLQIISRKMFIRVMYTDKISRNWTFPYTASCWSILVSQSLAISSWRVVENRRLVKKPVAFTRQSRRTCVNKLWKQHGDNAFSFNGHIFSFPATRCLPFFHGDGCVDAGFAIDANSTLAVCSDSWSRQCSTALLYP